MAGGNAAQKRERSRCAAIVRDRRQEIEHWMLTSIMLMPDQKKYVRRFLQVLTELEHKILEIPKDIQDQSIEYLGSFSAEEIERAQAIIAEQEHNPFEIIERE